MKKYLITSALPYVNNIPHIGNFVGSVLPADIYARFCRAQGRDTLFVCGADAHGSPIVIQAKKEGVTPAELVNKYHAAHSKIFNDFNISFDGGYGTTHTELQFELVHELFSALDKNGFIEEKTTIQPFSVDDNMFLADRQIEGTCPKCGFDRARGDQCDKCGELLDPSDLINPYAADSGSHSIEMRSVQNLFYRADLVHADVEKWFLENNTMWSKSAIAATKKYLTEDVPNPSVTRDLPWGIPVNKPGFEDKVFYVWFDAPWGYVSISQGANPDWQKWWFGGDDCHYAQFMGKDNIKFHSLFFPGQEIAWRDKNWKKVDQLKGMNFLNFEGDKISKSAGHGIFLDQALTDAPSDAWRYALIASAPETDDTDFTIGRFADIVNKDLNGTLGNFVSRVCKLSEKNFGATVPVANRSDYEIKSKINSKLSELTAALDACEFRKAIEALRGLWAIGNEFMTENAPWALVKTDKGAAGAILNECFGLIDFYARISAPFIPTAAEKMQKIFIDEKLDLSWPTEYASRLTPHTSRFTVPDNLFERIDDDKIKSMTEKYTKQKPKIVVAKILTVEKHPDSDHLSILTVDGGDGIATTVVCGAPNVRPGLVGVWARPGAYLPAVDLTLSARKVRGVLSHGMMCAADELGIGDDHDGIIELPEDSVIGDEYKS